MRSPRILKDLREYAEKSGQSRYRIAKEAKINEAAFYSFMAKKKGLSVKNIDKLMKYLDLEIRKKDDDF